VRQPLGGAAGNPARRLGAHRGGLVARVLARGAQSRVPPQETRLGGAMDPPTRDSVSTVPSGHQHFRWRSARALKSESTEVTTAHPEGVG
jgi:hypothetical protein